MSLRYKKFAVMAGMAGVLCAASVGFGAADPLISLSVQQTEMSDVLKFIAAQSGTSVVIAPDVSTRLLNLDLQDVPLSECLDVILKPYGYGYRRVGKTIVVDQLEGLQALTQVEPLQTRVFELDYLNANDVTNLVKSVLSSRGSCSVVQIAQVAGWQFSDASGEGEASKREREQLKEKDRVKSSKTLVVQDIPESVSRIAEVLSEIDRQAKQVDIRAYFVELKNDAIKDVGIEWGFAKTSGEYQTGVLNQDTTTSPKKDGTIMDAPALNTKTVLDLAEKGLKFGVLRDGAVWDVDMWLQAVQGNDDVNVLSAPRVLAQENQEAAILVGTRYPIVSFKEEDTGGSLKTTTKLEYYERIGIQLNVVPQICEDNLISMVVHPVVTEKVGDQGFKTATIDVSYPIIQTREAETRLSVEDGQTVAIGGLINDRREVGVNKIPLLGDIPLIGRLFRRDTTQNTKIELVIFLNASVQGTGGKDISALQQEVDRSEKDLPLTWEQFYKKSQKPAVESADVPVVEEPVVVIPEEKTAVVPAEDAVIEVPAEAPVSAPVEAAAETPASGNAEDVFGILTAE